MQTFQVRGRMTDHTASTPTRAHKWARTHAPGEKWRERLVRSCLARMKDMRTHTQDERRRARLRIVAEETERLRVDGTGTLPCSPVSQDAFGGWRGRGVGVEVGAGVGRYKGGEGGDGMAGAQDQAELVAFLEEVEAAAEAQQTATDEALQHILETMRREAQEADDEAAQLLHFHESMRGTDGGKDTDADGATSSGDAAIPCPMCGTGRVEVRGGVVECTGVGCRLRVECGTCDNVTAGMVRERLGQVFEQHQWRCAHRLGFGVRRTFGDFLWASCTACRFECIVL